MIKVSPGLSQCPGRRCLIESPSPFVLMTPSGGNIALCVDGHTFHWSYAARSNGAVDCTRVAASQGTRRLHLPD